MKKNIPDTDTTYCTNNKCQFKYICQRHSSHYEFNPDFLYWFAEFDEIECGKRKINEL